MRKYFLSDICSLLKYVLNCGGCENVEVWIFAFFVGASMWVLDPGCGIYCCVTFMLGEGYKWFYFEFDILKKFHLTFE